MKNERKKEKRKKEKKKKERKKKEKIVKLTNTIYSFELFNITQPGYESKPGYSRGVAKPG